MIAVDTNILVYAHREDSEFHEPAFDAIEQLRSSHRPWAVPWPCVHEFLAIVTHSRIYNPPSTLQQARGFIESLFASPQLQLLSESEGYFAKLCTIAVTGRVTGPRIHDARIAALCLHHGVAELWSADRDFSKFQSVKIRNPLVKL